MDSKMKFSLMFFSFNICIGKADNITLQGRFGTLVPRIYYITEEYVMSESLWTDVCQERGYLPLSYLISNNQYLFIKHELLDHFNWSTSQHLWFSLIKPYGNTKWLTTIDCSEKYYGISINSRNDPTVHDECLIVNMSSFDKDYTFWSSSCQEKYSLICYEDISAASSALVEYYNKSIILNDNLYFSTNFDQYDYERCWRLVRKSRRIVIGIFITYSNGTSCLVVYLTIASETASLTLIDDSDTNSTIFYKLLDDDQPTKVMTDLRTPAVIKNTNLPCITEITTASSYDVSLGYSSQRSIDCCGCTLSTNRSEEQINKEITEMKKKLSVEKRTLSSYTRTKVSVYDDRPTSVAIGSLGVVVMVFVFSLIVLPDIPFIVKEIRRIRS